METRGETKNTKGVSIIGNQTFIKISILFSFTISYFIEEEEGLR